MKTETMFSSEKSVDFQRTTQLYILEDSAFHNQCRKNLKLVLKSL
jgi:hypothetical protein